MVLSGSLSSLQHGNFHGCPSNAHVVGRFDLLYFSQ